MDDVTRRGFLALGTAGAVGAVGAASAWGPDWDWTPWAPTPASADTLANDIETIRQRLIAAWTRDDTFDDMTSGRPEWTYKSKATSYLAAQSADGSWPDVDYTETTSNGDGIPWSPDRALGRMEAMAAAAVTPSTPAVTRDQLVAGVQRALNHWFGSSPPITNTNWWVRGIGIQLHLHRVGLMLKDRLDATTRNKIAVLLNYYSIGVGTNAVWFIQQILARGVLADDGPLITRGRNNLAAAIAVTAGTGLQVDGSHHEHNQDSWVPKRELLYIGGYGRSMLNDTALWMWALRGTQFAFPLSAVSDHLTFLLQGWRWFTKGEYLEHSQPRETYPNYSRNSERTRRAAQWTQQIAPDQTIQIGHYIANLNLTQSDNGLIGAKAFWKSDFFAHHRTGWALGLKLTSVRTIGGEVRVTNSLPNNVLLWLYFGATYISRTGSELSDLLPIWDWSKIPGVTHPDYLAASSWQKALQDTTFVGAIDNGLYGAAVMDLNYSPTSDTSRATKAKKAWFAFDDEFVALGAGITSTDPGPSGVASPTITTVQQSVTSGAVVVGGQTLASGTQTSIAASWAHHDGIAYAFPGSPQVRVSNKPRSGSWHDLTIDNLNTSTITKSVFALWLDHGVSPNSSAPGSYVYVVRPGLTAAQAPGYAAALPVRVIANTTSVQAVRHEVRKIAQLALHAAGTVTVRPGLAVTVSSPALLIVDESVGSTPVLTVCDPTKTLGSLTVSYTLNGATSTTTVALPTGELAGRSVRVGADPADLALRRPTLASSHKLAQDEPHFATDGNPNTRWTSAFADNQWLRIDLQDPAAVNRVRLTWEAAYAKAFSVETSTDGLTWTPAYSTTNGPGGVQDLTFTSRAARFIRLSLTTRATGYGFSLWGVEVYGTPDLARGKTVTASTTGDKLTPASVTDGDPGTQWASLVADPQWVSVDLGSTQSVRAVVLHWEASAKAYTIQTSLDGATWSTVFTRTDGVGGVEVAGFAPVNARHVRMHGTARNSPYGYALYALRVFG